MRKTVFLPLAGILALLAACDKNGNEPTPEKKEFVTYKVVSHRGGYKESGAPECSIQGLTYSKTIGCYAAECDIVPTADGKALVCHPDDNGKVNGFLPYEKTLAEIVRPASSRTTRRSPSSRISWISSAIRRRTPTG